MDQAPSLMPTRNRSTLPVLGAGLVTSALALLGVWAINQATDDFNIMGWTYLYIIPIGALLVGLVAGSGYGLASFFTGVRISRNLLFAVLLLQVLAYFVAQYIAFRHLQSLYGDLQDMSFFEFFDLSTRSWAFEEKDGSTGSPLGVWGYAFRFLEIGGFAFGGILAPLILRSKHYCENCQMYMRTRQLGLIPAGVTPKKIKKKDTQGQAEFNRAAEEAWNQGQEVLERLKQAGSEGRTTDFMGILEEHRSSQKEYGKLATRISLSLSECPSCHAGLLNAVSVSGKGNKLVQQALGSSPLDPGLNREIGKMK